MRIDGIKHIGISEYLNEKTLLFCNSQTSYKIAKRKANYAILYSKAIIWIILRFIFLLSLSSNWNCNFYYVRVKTALSLMRFIK